MILVCVAMLLLTGVYSLTVASLAWQDLVTGAAFSAILLYGFRGVLFPKKLPAAGSTLRAVLVFPIFTFIAIRDIFVGTWLVTQFVVGLRKLEHPGIIAVPIGRRSKAAVGVSGLVLTLSPGSFLVDVDWERREMLVHMIDGSDPDAAREAYDHFYDRYEQHVVP